MAQAAVRVLEEPADGPGGGTGGSGSTSATYVYTNTSGAVSAYRLNTDGSLGQLAGSPFKIAGDARAASGPHLFASTSSQVAVYGIDAQTGSVSPESQVAVPGAGQVAAAGNFVYASGNDSSGNWAVYAFAVAQNGALAAVAGSPFFLSNACDLCASPMSITADAKYLLIGEGNGHNGEGGVALFARNGNGTLQRTSLLGTDGGVISVALHPSDRFAYAVDGGDEAILVDSIDPSGHLTQVQFLTTTTDVFSSVAVDPSGRYAVVGTASNTLISYVVNPDGTLTTLADRVHTNSNSGQAFPAMVTFDPSGHFVALADRNGLFVYSFNESTGTLTEVGSAATSSPPSLPVVARF